MSWADWLLVVIAWIVLSALAYLIIVFAEHGPFSRHKPPHDK